MGKRIPPILLLLAPYLYAGIQIVCGQTGYTLSDSQSGWIFVCAAAVFIINMVYAFVAAKWESGRELLFWDMLVKLCYIPIYILVFLFGAVMALVPKGIVFVPFLAVFDYFLLLPSTMYGVSGLIKASKEGKLPASIAVICGILHFFFCTDVICAIVAYCLVKSKERKTVMNCVSGS